MRASSLAVARLFFTLESYNPIVSSSFLVISTRTPPARSRIATKLSTPTPAVLNAPCRLLCNASISSFCFFNKSVYLSVTSSVLPVVPVRDSTCVLASSTAVVKLAACIFAASPISLNGRTTSSPTPALNKAPKSLRVWAMTPAVSCVAAMASRSLLTLPSIMSF